MTSSSFRECHIGVLSVFLISTVLTTGIAIADSHPGNPMPDLNIVGPTKDPDDIRDFGLKQQNEPACAIRPGDSDCVICFFNDYRTVDIANHGDAWIAQAGSCDATNTWTSRVVPGHPNHPSPIDAGFAADPRVIAIPGMAIHGFIGGFRGQDRGVIAIQHWLENNQEDFNHYEPGLDTIIVAEGTEGRFIDKPDIYFQMNGDSPQDTVTLSTVMEDPELGTIERSYPAGTLYAAYAVFTGSSSVKLLVKKSNTLGATWPNKTTKLTEGQNLVSGITLTGKDNIVMAMWRQVLDVNDKDAMYYAMTTNGGNSWSKPELLTEVCKFDQPSATISTPPQVTFRTNDFPWLANDGKNIYAFYTERVGDCATGTPRIAMRYTTDGVTWHGPDYIDNEMDAGVGAQFMPAAFGVRGNVQVAWYDTRRENIPVDLDQPFIADYIPEAGTRVNRTVDVYTARVTSDDTGGNVTVSESVRVNQYRTVADVSNPTGPRFEIETSHANAMMYQSGFLAFLGDYLAVAGQEFRPDGLGGWEANYSPLPEPASNISDFFIAYTDHRDVRGDVLFGSPGGAATKPYTPPDNVAPEMAGAVNIDDEEETMFASEDTTASGRRSTEGVEDTFTDPATVCVPEQDKTRNANIYGSLIRGDLRFRAAASSRPLSGILRAIPFTVTNVSSNPKSYRVYISNQPGEPSDFHRASFRQKPDRPPFTGQPDPELTEDFTIEPNSTIARTVFMVSNNPAATVDVQIFDGVCADNADAELPEDTFRFVDNCNVLASIEIGGKSPAGPLRQPDYDSASCAADPACNDDVNLAELHNPLLENPLLENPLLENPLLENPLLENMELEAPLLENPLLENPLLENFGFENPLLENPLLENPLLENLGLANPLLENPLLENPLLENSAFEDGVTYMDVTAVIRNDGNVTTAYNVDLTAAGVTTTGGEDPVSQLILWKQYVYATSVGCEIRPIAKNQVLTTINQPDDLFEKASIDEPFAGEASLVLAAGERGYVTGRFFGTPAELANVAIREFTTSAQAANCREYNDEVGPQPGEDEDDFYICESDLGDDRERIVIEIDNTGPEFVGLTEGQVIPVPAVQANAPGGACVNPVDDGIVMAVDASSSVAGINCFNAEGDAICLAAGDTGLSVPVSNLVLSPGPSPMTCIASDTNGNSTSIDLFLDVIDEDDPLFTMVPLSPTIVSAGDQTGTATITFEGGFEFEDFASVDPDPQLHCVTDLGQVSGDELQARNHLVDCTLTDASGNSVTHSYIVNVADVTPPIIAVLGANPFSVELGTTFTEPGVSAADAVDPAVMLSSNAAAAVDVDMLGSYTVIYTATDSAGNSSTATRVVNVVDTDPPDFSNIPVGIVIEATSSGGATISYVLPDATDESMSVTVSCVPTPGTVLPVGMHTVTCTATDSSGNEAIATFPVEILDTTAPDITVPDEVFGLIEGPAGATVNYLSEVSATDLVDPSPSLSCTPASGSLFAPGQTVVNCTATDAAGNTASDSFTVTVGYASGFGITPNKLNPKAGSSNPLTWGWRDANGITIDTSGDLQILRLIDCDSGDVTSEYAGDPGSSGFKVKSDLSWEYNWQSDDLHGAQLPKGTYCLSVENDLTKQTLESPPIRLR